MTTNSKQQNRPETWGFIAAIVLANLTLLIGKVCNPLVFLSSRVQAGEWWRLITYPLVHVSFYHLLLDAGAFLLLYRGLQETSARKRMLYVGACGAMSLIVSLFAATLDGGLCGLSGIAHGLMAVSALEIMNSTDRTMRNAGIICFLVVVLKSIYEAATGHVIFESLHLGSIDTPVAVCHAGGVLGGLCAYATITRLWNTKKEIGHD